jgi:hypothetical protein
MGKKSTKRKAPVLVWQRGYRCHTLWNGKERIGRISLGKYKEWDGVYRCEAGTQSGTAASLADAKRWVGEQALRSLIQMPLF